MSNAIMSTGANAQALVICTQQPLLHSKLLLNSLCQIHVPANRRRRKTHGYLRSSRNSFNSEPSVDPLRAVPNSTAAIDFATVVAEEEENSAQQIQQNNDNGGGFCNENDNLQEECQYWELYRFYAWMLRRCVKERNLNKGRMVHAQLVKLGMEEDLYFNNFLISVYAKLQSDMNDAGELFRKAAERDVVTWTATISGFARCGRFREAFILFVEMQRHGIRPNEYTFTNLLRISGINQVRQIHAGILKTNYQHIIDVGNVLIDVYGSYGELDDARQVFDKMNQRDCISWNTMIANYAACGFVDEAIEMFIRMHCSGIQVEEFSFSSVLTGISASMALDLGLQIHSLIIKAGFTSNLVVNNSLVSMYGKCACIESCWKIFGNMVHRDVISYTNMITACAQNEDACGAFRLFQQFQRPDLLLCNAMISGFVQNREGKNACRLFGKMLQAGFEVDPYTLSSVINACALLSAEIQGRQLHAFIVKGGFDSSMAVGNALVDMYAKAGFLSDAQMVFDLISEPNQIPWTTIISGYSHNGESEYALDLLRQMQAQQQLPDKFCMSAVIGACGNLGSLHHGKQLHAYVLRNGFASNVEVQNALITMYSRCGYLENSYRVFRVTQDKNACSWNAMISAYSQHGLGKEALQLFKEMQKERMQADGITFLAVLSACKCLGLIAEGFKYFNSMTEDHGITPWDSHYACMVHILACGGLLHEAEEFVNSITQEPDIIVWQALFRAARTQCNLQVAKRAAENILALEPKNPAKYVLHANIYASVGWFDAARGVRRRMKNIGIRKSPARSWMFHKKKHIQFLVNDRLHPQIEEIHAMLHHLMGKAKEAGYIPDTSFVMHDVEPYHKEYFITYHSAKLVLAFGILEALPGAPIRVFKSVCICGDCHAFYKYVSSFLRHEIILRDACCVHRFKNGICLCGDYW